MENTEEIQKQLLKPSQRVKLKKILTHDLGKVVEDDKKLICYVDKSKVKTDKYQSSIACFGIAEKWKKIAKAYNLNKQICYVIDGFEFKEKTHIYSYFDSEVIIKNCNFKKGVYIHTDNKCTIDNTNFAFFSYGTIKAKNLIIKNMKDDQIELLGTDCNIYFKADERINIIDSSINTNSNNGTVFTYFVAPLINIINSQIKSQLIECKALNTITDENSSLTATVIISLETDDFNSINITAPTILLNNEEISKENDSIILKKITNKLTLKRHELIRTLKNVKKECIRKNSERLSKYKSELESQPIGKTLK